MGFFRRSHVAFRREQEGAEEAPSSPKESGKRASLAKATEEPKLWLKQQRDNAIELAYEVPDKFVGKPVVVAASLVNERKLMQDAQADKRLKTSKPMPAGATPMQMTEFAKERTAAMRSCEEAMDRGYTAYQTKFGQPDLRPIDGMVEYIRLEDDYDADQEDDDLEDGKPHWTDLKYRTNSSETPFLAESSGVFHLRHTPQNAELEIFVFFDAVDDRGERNLAPIRTLSIKVITNKATWAAMLSQEGMSSLVPTFERNSLTHVRDWAEIIDDEEERIRLQIDEVAAERLNAIIARFGFITTAERERIARENEELHAFLEETKALMENDTQEVFYMGQLVETRTRRPVQYVVLTSPDADDEAVVAREALGESKQVGQLIPVAELRPSSWTLFLSHAQREAQNQVQSLHLLLRNESVPCWYDMDAEKLEAVDMLRGIRDSKFFLLYLTEGYLERFFCRLEATFAMTTQKKVIIVYESDNRHGGGQYTDLIDRCTAKFPEFRDWLMATEAIPMARRAFQREAMIHEILKRVGITKHVLSRNRGSGSLTEAKLRGEVEDLKEEVNKLWSVVEALQDQLAAQQLQ
ncbi:Hypothetical Protein FCC1311_003722 [Hondaea fermentalgiana]|uniref:TIR domain-containing protein n=1 Tax=Hondaea fermentalgiana TaxID=2315210 RepID=A0A2R5G917_9STRA|nr:Hypothetical Protein FCC1311_003722 [Hondaea fermentalgiana]|eukprot:GBG24154.1 Hypothetical Protein FCC1311_003722 [Hondaea fermentalgiana]